MANQIFKPKKKSKIFLKKSQNLFENATTNYTNVNYHQIWNYFKTAMLSEDIQKKECREKKRKQKRDTNTKLKTHLNVTPKTNEKKK